MQREPYEGQQPTERTEVRVLYTKHSVYFRIICYDSNPKGIGATELRRDVSQHLEDYFEIIIDSAHDRRNAYVFQITPLGTQRDALIAEEQQGDSDDDGDSGWDGVWTSEASITHIGWTATVAIPFSTLNFMKSNDVIWGINFNSSRDQPISNTVDGLQIQLVIGLDVNKAHVLALHGFGDRLGIHKSRSCWTLQTGFTNCAAISRTSCPCFFSARPRRCAPEQASSPIRDVCMFAVYVSNCRWVNFFRNTTLPAAPRATR